MRIDPRRRPAQRCLISATQTTDDDLRYAFEKYGQVKDAFIPKDRETGKAKGFGFVTLTDKRDADDAIAALDGFACGHRYFQWPHVLLQQGPERPQCHCEPRPPA